MGDGQHIQDQQVTLANSMPLTTQPTIAGHSFVPEQPVGAQIHQNVSRTGNRPIGQMPIQPMMILPNQQIPIPQQSTRQPIVMSVMPVRPTITEEDRIFFSLVSKHGSVVSLTRDSVYGGYELKFNRQNISSEEMQTILQDCSQINITSVCMICCRGFNSLHGISSLLNLKRLDLLACPELTSLSGISNLSNIIELCLRDCTGLTSLQEISNLQTLEVLDLWRCSGLTSAEGISNLSNISTIDFSSCENLHGTIDLSNLHNLTTLCDYDIPDDVTIITSSEAPISRSRVISLDSIDEEVENIEQYRSILRDANDISTANRIIAVAEDSNGTDVQKTDFKNFLKSYCERYANTSGAEKTKAAEKYMTALKNFEDYLKDCSDAFATGLAKLKIELGLGELLEQCKTPQERRQVLFGAYLENQIQESIMQFDLACQDLGNEGIGELLELQLMLNVLLNTPHAQTIKYAQLSQNVASALTEAYDNNMNTLNRLVQPGLHFLNNHKDLLNAFINKLTEITFNDYNTNEVRNMTQQEAQVFKIPLEIVLTSMLQNEEVSGQFADRKFNTFLLSEQEYWPLITKEITEEPCNMTIEEVEGFVGKNFNDAQIVRSFIEGNIGKPIDPDDSSKTLQLNSPLKDMFDAFDNRMDFDGLNIPEGTTADAIYEAIGRLENKQTLRDAQLQVIIDDYEVNYEQRLAEHLMNALTGGQQ